MPAPPPAIRDLRPQSEEITLTWLLRKVACDADLAALTASLNPADLDAPRPVNVAPGQVAALDLQPPAGRPPVGTCSNGPERPSWGATDCTAVVLAAREGTAALAVAARIRLAGSRSLCQPMRSPADDPGPEAVSIVESGAGLRFVGGSNVRLVEVSPAVIATRPPDPRGCHALLAQERAIRESASACTMDDDCQRLDALPVVSGACDIYLNRAAPLSVLQTLHDRWSQTCASDPIPSNCPTLRPAACSQGICQGACPGVPLGVCPATCAQSGPRRLAPGDSCPSFVGPCEAADGTWCDCRTGKLTCAPAPMTPDCPLHCLPPRP